MHKTDTSITSRFEGVLRIKTFANTIFTPQTHSSEVTDRRAYTNYMMHVHGGGTHHIDQVM